MTVEKGVFLSDWFCSKMIRWRLPIFYYDEQLSLVIFVDDDDEEDG